MLKNRKSQAAMEFLMTYGWAILVVLIVIGALAYFGVLNPQRLLPERCTFPTGISCRDHIASASGENITLEILNGLGRDIKIIDSYAEGTAGNPVLSCNTTNPYDVPPIKNGETGNVVFDNCAYENGGSTPAADINTKYRWNVGLRWYYTDSSPEFAKTYSGELFATWQP